MTEEEWMACNDPTPMLEFLSVPGGDNAVLEFSAERVSRRKMRLFCVACCRMVWTHFVEPEVMRAVELSETFADDPTVHSALCEASRVVNDINDEEWFSGFAGGPTTPGLWDRTAVAWEASKVTVRPEGVAAKVVIVAGEVDENGPTSQMNAALLRDILGPLPFSPITLNPTWLTPTVLNLARAAYEERALPSGELAPDRLGVLSDALEEAGCDNEDILNHLRSPGPHVRGCWGLDLLLGKE